MNKLENLEQKELFEKFKEISNKGYIKGINQNTNSVGLTFEKLLNKESDSMFFPDYKGIEIKCSQRYSRYPINLFSISFDGPNLYEMNRLLLKYGKSDFKYPNKKILQNELMINELTFINGKYFFKLELDEINQKLYVVIYDINYKLIEKENYIELKKIKDRLELKLSRLALVLASKKEINNEKYFRYYKITLYKLKSFETFIELLKENRIKVTIEGRISRSGIEEGRQRNKNIVFKLPKENIELLFAKTCEYTTDKNIEQK